MAMHPSLKLSDKDKRQRSVLKRTERLRIMMEKGAWKEGDSVYNLPKIKTVKIKIRKEKAAAEKPEAAVPTEGAAAPARASVKEQAAPAKVAAKVQEKK